MARHDPVVDHLIELLAPLGEPEAKRMFGVRGVYLDGLMVALVADGRVYLKADAENLPEFEAARSLPFAFRRKQRTITSSYCSVTREELDSSRSLEPGITVDLQAARINAPEPPRTPPAPRLPITCPQETGRASRWERRCQHATIQ